ncbi:septum site-determining protein MinC [Alkalihalobacillus sp. AL-G]|uniref:septum site-determining protein MinC n=1 Tax=Alkalihalobacillus sp. AL-G TaxID=2926399 RepID=UPI00272AF61D|nr:septum site-determining protein MinC [Alkalihalobacillus sp. AL-G]WLD92238.1 septum site-determining protein MinC [Alkalihalobacillus sp. AL-G]
MAQKQKQGKPHYVTIKGTKEGLILHLDDDCSFDQLLSELEAKLIRTPADDTSDMPKLSVNVKVGKRYLSEEQKDLLRKIVYQQKHLLVDEIDSDVITKDKAEELRRETEVTSVSRMVRSGQILKVQGDLLLVGDVNPGGCVIATGNIFVMGALKGTAHAGFDGKKDAIVTAAVMDANMIRIADEYVQAEEGNRSLETVGECAFLDEESRSIKFDRINILHQIRPGLNRL